MQKILLFLFITPFLTSGQQFADQIKGVYWTGTEEKFTDLDLMTGVFTDIATLPNVAGVSQGMSTFDKINNRYFFIESTMGVVSVDAQSGAILNNYPNQLNLQGIEYNEITDQIVGIHWTGTEEKIAYLDLMTGVFTDIATLPNVAGVPQGMSTFDKINNRYFFIENAMGVVSVDAQSGAILNNYFNPLNVHGIEYNENTDQIVGIYWTGTEQKFAHLDFGSGLWFDIATLPNVLGVTQGMSTFDQKYNRYFFIESNMGVVSVDAQSGVILNNYPNAILHQIEYIGENTIIQSNIMETHFNKNLIKEVNLLGKTTKRRKNTPLLYIYDDGTVEKRMIIE